MLLTDQEFIDARKRALEQNPRSYAAWSETINFGREVERMVLSKYWNDAAVSRPVEEGWYAALCHSEDVDVGYYVENLFWSNQTGHFSHMIGGSKFHDPVVRFKPLKEFIEQAGLSQRVEEEGSLAHQGIDDEKEDGNVR